MGSHALLHSSADEVAQRYPAEGPFPTTPYDKLAEARKDAEGLSELGKVFAPTYLRVRQAELEVQPSEELLLAGLNQLRNPGAPLPASKVTGDSI